MGFSTVLIISLAAGVILIVGGGLMMYMANLVKSAYEIKVQINTEVDDRLSKMGEDLDKKSKWIKRDLVEEFEKIKGNMQSESVKRVEELGAPLINRIEALEAQLRNDQAEWRKALEAERQTIAALESKLKLVSKTGGRPTPAAGGERNTAAPTLAGERPKPSATAPKSDSSAPAAAPAADAKPSGPAPVGSFLQELK